MPDTGYKGDNLVFIVGCPRSGTTWLQRLLASNPNVKTGHESDIFDIYIGPQLKAWKRDILPENSGRGIIGLGCYFTEEQFIQNLKSYLMLLLEPMIGNLQEGQLFIEKTPSHALFIPEIHMLLPKAKFIHIIRDPRDVIASLLAVSKSWGWFWAPKDAISAAAMWLQHVGAVREAQKNIQQSQFMELSYEHLSQDSEKYFSEVLRFLGLAWTEDEVLFALKKNSYESVRTGKGTAITVGGESQRSDGMSTLVEPKDFVRKAKVGGWKDEISFTSRIKLWRYLRNQNAFGYHLSELSSWF